MAILAAAGYLAMSGAAPAGARRVCHGDGEYVASHGR
jgi:hypothetical protein